MQDLKLLYSRRTEACLPQQHVWHLQANAVSSYDMQQPAAGSPTVGSSAALATPAAAEAAGGTPAPGSTCETATFAAGCFWGAERAFSCIDGVIDTKVGYTGGHTLNPTYEHVCSGKTGHTEAVQLRFNPATVTYEALLDAFFYEVGAPVAGEGCGGVALAQYRNCVFHHSDSQRQAAEQLRREAQSQHGAQLAVDIEPAGAFWPAEGRHQRYLQREAAALARASGAAAACADVDMLEPD